MSQRLVDSSGEPFPQPPEPKPSIHKRTWAFLQGLGIFGHILAGVGTLIVLTAGGLITIWLQSFSAGVFEAHAELLPDDDTTRRTLVVRMVNNSEKTVSVRRIDLEITAEGEIQDGYPETRAVTSSAKYVVRLEDVLPYAEPSLSTLRLPHVLQPAEVDEVEIEMLLADFITVTGTYVVRPTLVVQGEEYPLDTVRFRVRSNLKQVVEDPAE